MHEKPPVASRVYIGPVRITRYSWIVRVQPSQLDAFAKAKLGGIPKTTFLSLWPKYCDKEETIAFNTDKFAEQAIKNATVAGVDPSKIVLEVSTNSIVISSSSSFLSAYPGYINYKI